MNQLGHPDPIALRHASGIPGFHISYVHTGDSLSDPRSVRAVCFRDGILFAVLFLTSLVINLRVGWRPWRIYSWVYSQNWPPFLDGLFLGSFCGITAFVAWLAVISPVAMLIAWGAELIRVINPNSIGLAVMMPGSALLLALYALGLWYSTKWQSSRAASGLLFASVLLICGYEVAAVYLKTGIRDANTPSKNSGYFFGISAIAVGIDLLPLIKMVFSGPGLNVDEWVTQAYLYARRLSKTGVLLKSQSGLLPEGYPTAPPQVPNRETDERLTTKRKHGILLYGTSALTLLVYSIVYYFTADKARWLGFITSAALIVLDSVTASLLLQAAHYERTVQGKRPQQVLVKPVLRTPTQALLLASVYRLLLISFGIHYWYLGHCLAYVLVGCILAIAAMLRFFPVVSENELRRQAFGDTIEKLRGAFRTPTHSQALSEQLSSGLLREGPHRLEFVRESSLEGSFSSSSELEAGINRSSGDRGSGDGMRVSLLRESNRVSSGSSDRYGHSRVRGEQSRVSDGVRAEQGGGSDWFRGQQSGLSRDSLDGQSNPRSSDPDRRSSGSDRRVSGTSSRVSDNTPRVSGTSPIETNFRVSNANSRVSESDGAEQYGNGHGTPRANGVVRGDLYGADEGPNGWGEMSSMELQEFTGVPSGSLEAAYSPGGEILPSGGESKSVKAKRPSQDLLRLTPAEEALVERGDAEKKRKAWKEWLRKVLLAVAGTPGKVWALLSALFVMETVLVALSPRPEVEVINDPHKQYEFGLASLLCTFLAAVLTAHWRALRQAHMRLTWAVFHTGVFGLGTAMGTGLLLAFLTDSSIIFALAITLPFIVASLSIGVPIWVRNGCQFFAPRKASMEGQLFRVVRLPVTRKDLLMVCVVIVNIASIICMGLIIAREPLSNPEHEIIHHDHNPADSPYKHGIYYGWAIAAGTAVAICAGLPIYSWFTTFRLSKSSMFCLATCLGVLLAFGVGSHLAIRQHRAEPGVHQDDVVIAILPVTCIPALLCLGVGLFKWRDDSWRLSKEVVYLVAFGVALLLAAIVAIIATIQPWTIGVALLLFLCLVIIGISLAYRWVGNRFRLTRWELLVGGLAVLVLATLAFGVGWKSKYPLVGASVGYFSLLILCAGWALSRLLGPSAIVYSPRVLPVFTFDPELDRAIDRSMAFLVLYLVALGTAAWGVLASVWITPSYAGSAVCSLTLVIAYAFAESRPRMTVKMMENALVYLNEDDIVLAITKATEKIQKIGGSRASPPQGEPLPEGDIKWLRKELRKQEVAGGPWLRRSFRLGRSMSVSRKPPASDAGAPAHHRLTGSEEELFPPLPRKTRMQAHKEILRLEKAIDQEWLTMWGSFGGYLLLTIGMFAEREKVQDDVRLRMFQEYLREQHNCDFSIEQMKKWAKGGKEKQQLLGLEREFFEQKRRKEERIARAREEEAKGKQKRHDKRHEKSVEAVRRRIRRAEMTNVPGCICIEHAEPAFGGRYAGDIPASMADRDAVSISAAVRVDPLGRSERAFVVGTCGQRRGVNHCLELILVERGGRAMLGLRVVSERRDGLHVGPKEYIFDDPGATGIMDTGWHCVALVLDATHGSASVYIDGEEETYHEGVIFPSGPSGVWKTTDEIWIGQACPLDEEQNGLPPTSNLEIMDVFLVDHALDVQEAWNIHSSTFYGPPAVDMDLVSDDVDMAPEAPPVVATGQAPLEGMGYAGSQSGQLRSPSEGHGTVNRSGPLKRGNHQRGDRKPWASTGNAEFLRKKLPTFEEEAAPDINAKMLAYENVIRQELYRRREDHYVDIDFPPHSPRSVFDTNRPNLKLQELVAREWKRPSQLSDRWARGREPCLFRGSPRPEDVRQGRLGDCWFLSAVSVLAEQRDIREVLITERYNREGIYTVRFNIEGAWKPVVVDDYLPCKAKRPDEPVFATSSKAGELWVSILEKAYAKLHGCYEALEGGVVQDALVDLTGGAGEEIDMASPASKIDLASGKLWRQLLRFKAENFLLGAGSPSGSEGIPETVSEAGLVQGISDAGIVQSHAYSILNVVDGKDADGHQLLQIRNPWASGQEWNGPWSDTSKEWTERMKHKLNYDPKPEDGIFWMAWEDFQIHFRSIYVCRTYDPKMRHIVKGEWKGPTAGGCSNFPHWHHNPQFLLKTDEARPVHVFMTLTQGPHNGNMRSEVYPGYTTSADRGLYYIVISVLKKGGRRAGEVLYASESVGGSEHVNTREVACELVLEPYAPGYTIVPTTYRPGEECTFTLSVFTRHNIKLTPIQM